MEKINFKIATPEKVVFKADVDQITLPTMQGEITILPNHIPLIGVLQPGEIRIKRGTEDTILSVSGGFIEVLADKVVALADTAERAEELDIERAEAAKKRAEEALENKRYDAKEFARLSAMIEKETARIRVAKKHRIRIDYKGIGQKKYNE
ncbi:ATP synthase F1 subunit epsilon [Candidatus Falkowbacteria bacterium RIFOXYD2_FULL_35_9]|uniref:ATP synthase epsilon chain n=1 Tax=Candidatus Falkowbacteria bacterium RIFOXYC2_FULL_36_12 TaxID=1798002 RepID=A0A1F5SY41_9BACT|nr:MAG: ATP synthase F1 subunit epsilon [Candidatus Falkowbacteria bacterium RIFOXYB2_FULL_35_7]OGF31635.1 MAG: ATP synthase F1 subunit epsilon [Candidatus Falkowbacteria bacterium RIFOXYC2_FULL_36_12]OGF34181.1 MAG: ATP synthase F1 subunit epsilon [Candidatus Falkowbacteria bacterium RIFOXYA2_FULL_35_8]OGF46703.1 MAG: ATP synthase F1 subunit epsilon [Candidatus Falkowbacteria bacterium RIFOXYD2_FULL_35_9]